VTKLVLALVGVKVGIVGGTLEEVAVVTGAQRGAMGRSSDLHTS
jgi:hypothetical protein